MTCALKGDCFGLFALFPNGFKSIYEQQNRHRTCNRKHGPAWKHKTYTCSPQHIYIYIHIRKSYHHEYRYSFTDPIISSWKVWRIFLWVLFRFRSLSAANILWARIKLKPRSVNLAKIMVCMSSARVICHIIAGLAVAVAKSTLWQVTRADHVSRCSCNRNDCNGNSNSFCYSCDCNCC